jgi:PUA domain protein
LCVVIYIDPFILPHQQVDKGAIKFILSGANIMCPGLTSPGANLLDAEKDAIIVSFYFKN